MVGFIPHVSTHAQWIDGVSPVAHRIPPSSPIRCDVVRPRAQHILGGHADFVGDTDFARNMRTIKTLTEDKLLLPP